MKLRWLAVAAVLTCGVARAQDEEDSIAKIRTDLGQIFRAMDANNNRVAPKESDFLALIDRAWKVYDVSAGEPAEYDSLYLVMELSAYAPKSAKVEEHWRDAMGKVVKEFVDDPRLTSLVVNTPAPRSITPKETEQVLGKIKATTKSPDVKAAFEFREIEPLIQQQGDGQLNDAETQKLIESLKKLAADYPDAKVPRYGTAYKLWVEKKIYVIEHLKVGEVAPDIEGPDLDGVKFKLSDYRGKVVMLDFWGYW
jgi:hypothetical protein